jgi:hypothetical protein
VFYDHDAYLGDARCMEPVVFRRQPSEERRVACVMCGQARGYSISCRWPGCQRHFHARCAQRSGFLGMSAELGGLVTQAFCDQHRHERVNAHEILASLLAIVDGTPVSPTITAMQVRLFQALQAVCACSTLTRAARFARGGSTEKTPTGAMPSL